MVALASGKNILTGIRDSLKVDAGKTATDFDDAATGTVQADRTAKQEASTCDGQLAAALVQANDLVSTTQSELEKEAAKYLEALENITGLQRELRQATAKVVKGEDALSSLEDKMTGSLKKEQNRSKKELESLKQKSEKDLKALMDEKDKIISSLKEESAALLDSVKKSADKKFQDLETEKNGVIGSLTAQLQMSAEELEATGAPQLEACSRASP